MTIKQLGVYLFILSTLGISSQSQFEIDDRNVGWRMDLNYLTSRMEKQHKNLFHTIKVDEWEAAKQKIHNQIPEMSDLQIIGEFSKLMSRIGDGHTVLYPPLTGKYSFSELPLEFYLFKNELFVRGADPQHKHLVGSRVMRAGTLPIETVLERARNFLGTDNSFQARWLSPVIIMYAEIYQLIGATTSESAVEFTFEAPDGESFVETVEAGPITRNPMSRFVPDDWVDMDENKTSLWVKTPDDYFWFEYLDDKKLVYLQFNQVRNKPEKSIAGFSYELSEFIDSNPVRFLVIDLRLNNGGNNVLNQFFVNKISGNKKINQHGRLFTIIGRRTFSAAMNLVSDLENRTNTIFVGEPTSSKPNFYGEEDGFKLPYSGLEGSISSKYWQGGSDNDTRQWVAPDLIAELTASQYSKNEDPALEAIFEYIEASWLKE